jgi:hypothetical protein
MVAEITHGQVIFGILFKKSVLEFSFLNHCLKGFYRFSGWFFPGKRYQPAGILPVAAALRN